MLRRPLFEPLLVLGVSQMQRVLSGRAIESLSERRLSAFRLIKFSPLA
jgi:hypothetical protein